MIVRHWMQADPVVIGSDTLVSEAKRILSENNLHALPVVDAGRLRGLVTRANLLRMGHFVLRTQNADEFNFFVSRLKVRDIMVRNPATVQADVWMRPWASVSGTRCTRWPPDSNLSLEYAPRPMIRRITSL